MELVFGIQLGVIEGQNLTGLISGPHTGLESREADLANLDQDRESGRFLQFGGVACRGSELRMGDRNKSGEPIAWGLDASWSVFLYLSIDSRCNGVTSMRS